MFGVSGVILIKNDKQEKYETNLEQIENNSHNENEENIVEKERQLSPLELLYTRWEHDNADRGFVRWQISSLQARIKSVKRIFFASTSRGSDFARGKERSQRVHFGLTLLGFGAILRQQTQGRLYLR